MICINEKHGKSYAFYNGDNIPITREMPTNSVDLEVYSPPFADLFVYSDLANDLGNSANDAEFFEHYAILLPELLRVLRPGRNCVVHCADLPSFIWKHGHAGLRDFSGELIRAHEAAGFIYHSRITIWKDPVTEMQRTNAHGLLWKNFQANSAQCRAGNPDYILVFRKPADDAAETPNVVHDPVEFPVEKWQEWASPVWRSVVTEADAVLLEEWSKHVWMDINQARTLNAKQAREDRDQKHMCPLQLDVIERVVKLWTNPGEVVYSPFGGIGSEGVPTIEAGRMYVACELKTAYWETGCGNLEAVDSPAQVSLFGR